MQWKCFVQAVAVKAQSIPCDLLHCTAPVIAPQIHPVLPGGGGGRGPEVLCLIVTSSMACACDTVSKSRQLVWQCHHTCNSAFCAAVATLLCVQTTRVNTVCRAPPHLTF